MTEKTCCKSSKGCCELTPAEMELLPELDLLLPKYTSKAGGLIPALQATQKLFGYLPQAAMKKIAVAFKKSYSEVAGVVSFYSFFSTVPRGKYLVRVCLGTACYVRGGKEVLGAIRRELGVDVGQTTADRLFSLDVGRCFGACGLAPVVMVNDDVFQRVRPSKVHEILVLYRAMESEGGEKK